MLSAVFKHLQTVHSQCTFDARHIKVVSAQDLEIPKLVAHAQFVIGLQLAAVTAPANALKVGGKVRIAEFQSLNQPCRYDVVYVAPTSTIFEIDTTSPDFADAAQSGLAMTSPIFS